MTSLPPSFKSLLSAFKRADELDKDPARENQIVAYHIRYWAVSKATKIMSGLPDEQKYVVSQLDILEKLSPQLKIAEGEGKRTCIQQATMLFDKADEIDRAGFADKSTAKLFYTSATIYDCLEQFGDQDPEILERKKYAKWKSADIVNSINAGQKPVPGGFGEQHPESEATEGSDKTSSGGSLLPGFDIPSAPVNKPVMNNPPPPPMMFSPPPAAPTNYPAFNPVPNVQQQQQQQQSAGMPYLFHQPPAPQPGAPQQQPANPHPTSLQQPQNYQFPVSSIPRGPPQSPADPRIKDSIELCNFAISALSHNNVALAKERLQEALRRLG